MLDCAAQHAATAGCVLELASDRKALHKTGKQTRQGTQGFRVWKQAGGTGWDGRHVGRQGALRSWGAADRAGGQGLGKVLGSSRQSRGAGAWGGTSEGTQGAKGAEQSRRAWADRERRTLARGTRGWRGGPPLPQPPPQRAAACVRGGAAASEAGRQAVLAQSSLLTSQFSALAPRALLAAAAGHSRGCGAAAAAAAAVPSRPRCGCH